MTGADIRQERIDAGITGADVARLFGRHRAAITRLEKRPSISAATVARYRAAIAEILRQRRDLLVEANVQQMTAATEALEVLGAR